MKKTVPFFIATGIFLGSFAIAGAVSTLVVQEGGSGRGTFTSSQLIYGNGINALSSVATSSIGAGTGLTFSGTSGAQVGGANGTFSVNTTQNITTLSNLSTAGTLNNTASGVLYSTATTSVTNGTGISFTGTAGALIGGTSLTITNTGVTSLAVTSPITTSGSTGSITVGCASCLTANQTVTLTGAVTGSGSTAITTAFGNAAANTVLANGTGATAVPTFVATSTLFTGSTGQTAYFSGTGLLIGTSTIFTTPASAVGIGTLTPAAVFDVQGTSTAATVLLADLWNFDATTVMRIRNDGNVGIGTTSPVAPFTVTANVNTNSLSLNGHVMVVQNTGSGNLPFVIDNSGSGNPNFSFGVDGAIKGTVGFIRSTSQLFMSNIAFSGSGQSFVIDSSGNFLFQNGSTNAELARLAIGGNFGIGTSTPAAKLDVYSSVSSTTPLLLEAVSGGGCIIIKDVAGAGYTQLYTQAGTLTAKVHTGALSSCN